jgi:hypothetical protein
VDAVDGTAAGDAFTACLLVSLLEERDYDDALRRACAAGALAASRHGASRRSPQPPRSTRSSADLVEGGDESLRRDDAVALLDPVAEYIDGDPRRAQGTVTQPALPRPYPVGSAPAIASAWACDSASLTDTRFDPVAREHEDLSADLDDDGVLHGRSSAVSGNDSANARTFSRAPATAQGRYSRPCRYRRSSTATPVTTTR